MVGYWRLRVVLCILDLFKLFEDNEVDDEGDDEDMVKTFSRKCGFLWTELQIEFHFLQRSFILSGSCHHIAKSIR